MLVTQDLHIHTAQSLCANATATLTHYCNMARILGLNTIALTDHVWDAPNPPPKYNHSYAKQPWEHIIPLRREMEALPEHPNLKILFGAEAEYRYETHGVAISKEHAATLDVLLIPNSHTHLTMPEHLYENHQDHIDFMHRAFLDICESDVAEYVTAIPHPFSAVCCPYPSYELMGEIKDSVYLECFQAAKEKKIAIEINTCDCMPPWETDSAILNSEPFRMFSLAKQCGCKFTFGSDSHGENGQNEFLPRAERYAVLLGLTQEDILYV